MANKTNVQLNGKVFYVDDPNSVNINNEMVNSIADYEDMHIEANLTAVRGSRSVIEINEGMASEDTIRVNFMGYNQNEGSSNENRFTTNYYDDSTLESEKQFESFGIQDIRIKVNSSFVPEIKIQFVDVRGLSFFNDDNSPYRILFDFPPPVFYLKIKGFYGKALEYKLHLVKYTTEFKSENGNFIIDADFIPLTFAPLTDVLFRYVTNLPLVGKNLNEIRSLTQDDEPKNTYDLVKKIEGLITELDDKIDDSKESEELNVLITNTSATRDLIDGFNNYANDDALEKGGTPIMFTSISTNTLGPVISTNPNTYKKLDTAGQFNTYFTSTGKVMSASEMKTRLYIGYLIPTTTPTANTTPINTTQASMRRGLDVYGARLKENATNINLSASKPTIEVVELVDNSTFVANITGTTLNLVAIDVTEYYIELYRNVEDNIKKSNTLNAQITGLKNKITYKQLGITPTIENVFKILLRDVDDFFTVLRQVSREAEQSHHINYKSQIANAAGYSDVDNKVYAFPLVTEEQIVDKSKTKVKIAPKKISDSLQEPFPEIKLVQDLIYTFILQARLDDINAIVTKLNDEGVNSWIPISSLDSQLNTERGVQSPYMFIHYMNADGINAMLQILLSRFYMLTQQTLPTKFYGDKKISDAYINYYASAEASNIALTISNTETAIEIISKVDGYLKNIDNNFYPLLYDIDKNNFNEDYTYYTYVPSAASNTSNAEKIYVDRSKGETGIFISDEDVGLQDIGDTKGDPLFEFKESVGKNWWNVFQTKTAESSYYFSSYNILTALDDKNEDGNNTKYETYYILSPDQHKLFSGEVFASTYTYADAFLSGNTGTTTSIYYKNIPRLHSLPYVWDWNLRYSKNASYRDNIVSVLNKDNHESMLMILSNFGYSLSPFNKMYQDLNGRYFSVPSIVKTPNFSVLYVGAIIYFLEELGGEQALKDIVDNDYTFTNPNTKETHYYGINIAADTHDILNYLSDKDKKLFKEEYYTFYKGNNNKLLQRVKNLITAAQKDVDVEELLEKGIYYDDITKVLIDRRNIIIDSEYAFKYEKPTEPHVYKSITDSNNINTKKEINDKFFTAFLNKLKDFAEVKKTDLLESKVKDDRLRYDNDIINETYYSLKNINDRWLTSPTRGKITGFPFCNDGENLIDLFAFVDRGMNPIGDTIINIESLVDMYQDPNISIFSVISQLLSTNNFEFFPLQNFLTHTEESWEKTFKIDTYGDVTHKAFFVCMYLGGTSSYPSGIDDNNFPSDHIDDISSMTTNEFSLSPSSDGKLINENVYAFNVLFSQQNQSMFKDIKIQSKDYPNTNESIQIMSRIAGDGQASAPVGKSQNLYSVFENRAYSATVTGLGNAMIQPTQYFQLSNIPLYHGAYMILGVEHHLTANNMTTSFTGTKVSEFQIPRVTDAFATTDNVNDPSISSTYSNNVSGVYNINLPSDKVASISTEARKNGITNKYVIASIIGVSYKESGLIPKSEYSYKNTSNDNIRRIFGCRVAGLTDVELIDLKTDDVKFFDRVYGIDIPSNCTNSSGGNTAVGDGFKYRGRGLNQITHKNTYSKYGKLINVDLINNPDKLNEFTIAAKVLVLFIKNYFKIGASIMKSRYGANNINDFSDTNTAYEAIYNLNAGLKKDTRYTQSTGKSKGRVAAEQAYIMIK